MDNQKSSVRCSAAAVVAILLMLVNVQKNVHKIKYIKMLMHAKEKEDCMKTVNNRGTQGIIFYYTYTYFQVINCY